MNEAKLWFWVLIDALIAALVITVLGIVLPVTAEWGASLAPSRTVTVTAEGKTTAIPDIAQVSFSVVSQGQDIQSITTTNTNKMNAVLQFVSGQGIATSDVETTGYNLQPNYVYGKDVSTPTINGYTLTETATVKIRDLSKVASVLSGLTPLGVNEIGGVNFTVDDPNTYLALARADALNQARIKAMQMAGASGASLGEVVNVAENAGLPGPLPIYAMSASAGSTGSGVASVMPTISPGSQDITDDVTVTYALR